MVETCEDRAAAATSCSGTPDVRAFQRDAACMRHPGIESIKQGRGPWPAPCAHLVTCKLFVSLAGADSRALAPHSLRERDLARCSRRHLARCSRRHLARCSRRRV